jgi:hypothetical protein
MVVAIPLLALANPVVAIFFGDLQKMQKLRIEEVRVRDGASGSGAVAAIDAEPRL